MKTTIITLLTIISFNLYADVRLGYSPGVYHIKNNSYNKILNEKNHILSYENKNNYRFLIFKNSFYEPGMAFSKKINLVRYKNLGINFNYGLGFGYRECYSQEELPKKYKIFMEKRKNKKICTMNFWKKLGISDRKHKDNDYIINPMLFGDINYKISENIYFETFLFYNLVGFGMAIEI